jgi:peptide/nickel transport system permease protein
MGSRRYLLRKVGQALATLAFVLAFNFFLFRIMPGDPIRLIARSNIHLTQAEQDELAAEFGLTDPVPQQFVNYIGDTLRGQLGLSFTNARPVTTVIAERIWPTVLLVGLSTVLSVAFGLLIGIRGGWRRGSGFDKGSLFGSLVLYSAPEGWLGMVFLIVFAGTLAWFPTGGYESPEPLTGVAHWTDVLNHLFLPALTLTLGYIGQYAVVMRSSLMEVMGEEFVTTARAKGLHDKLVRRRHAVPNALLPTLSLVFYEFGFVLGGSIIIEAVYSWPGLGQLTYRAISDLDYPIIQGIFLLFSAAVILFNLVADLLYGYLDPRVREG